MLRDLETFSFLKKKKEKKEDEMTFYITIIG